MKPMWFMWGGRDVVACYTIHNDKEFTLTNIFVSDIEGGVDAVVAAMSKRKRGDQKDPGISLYDSTSQECESNKPISYRTKSKPTLPSVNMRTGSGLKDMGI